MLRGKDLGDQVSVPRWYKIRLNDGVEGYVSKAWTKLVAGLGAHVPFEIHFLDVGVGDSAIINMQDKEVVIDGGNYKTTLHNYARDTGIIDDPVELAIVTHADSDHWKGFVRLFNFDGRATAPHMPLEFWEPGYDRNCRPLQSYQEFIQNMRNMVGDQNFHRPLESTHPPSADTGEVEPFTNPSVPGVTFTLLHSEDQPDGPECGYKINNASIALMIEISGVKILFTGDANGKDRDEPGPGTPDHIEAKLLEIERQHPGTLKADVLKVPHHGSETASTQEFIETVDPLYVIFSASTNHLLPRSRVVARYENGNRFILRTDANRDKDIDHIYCTSTANGEIACNYKDQFEP